MNASQNLTVSSSVVADELVVESVKARSACPVCGESLNKAVYADGDSERCCGCGENLWFELRGSEVIAHHASPQPLGLTLGEVLRAQQRLGRS